MGWTQSRVAAEVGCSQSYVAQVETGVRPISEALAEKLEALFGAARGAYRKAQFFRGRPPLTARTRAVRKQIRESAGLRPIQYEEGGRPKYSRPDWVRGGLGMWVKGQDSRFWDYVNSILFQSKAERRLNARVAGTGAQLVGASLGALGCELPVKDGLTGRDASDRPFPTYFLQDGDLAVAWSAQRCVRTPGGCRWPDNLLIAALGGRRRTLVVEVDGAPYHMDADKDNWRDLELGVPVLHLSAEEAGDANIVARILAWVREQF